jgi:histidyl-tRNA synthetase
LAAVEAMGLGEFMVVDLGIVRGLAYYTGPVFELFDEAVGLRAICGGGRYDGLLGALGSTDLPALGFGFGDVVLGELLKAREATPTTAGAVDAFLVGITPDDQATILGLARRLRDAGRAVEFALAPTAVRRQLELAGVRGARFAIIVGPDERAADEAVVRDMTTSEERRVPLAELIDAHLW